MEVVARIDWDKVSNGNSYLYGSQIQLLDEGVRFTNLRMASGKIISRWESRTNYQEKRYSPSLPLLESGRRYAVEAVLHSLPVDSVLLQFDFFNRQGEVLERQILRKKRDWLTCPEGTFTYTLSLLHAGCEQLDFSHIVIYREKSPLPLRIDASPSRGYRAHQLPEDLEFVRSLIQTL